MAYIDQELRFSGGMNGDISPEMLKPTVYRHARNIELLNEEEEDQMVVTNAEGNLKLLELPVISGVGSSARIIGYKHIRDKIIIFSTFNLKEGDSSTKDQIWVADYIEAEESAHIDSDSLKYNKPLNFSAFDSISEIEIDYRDQEHIYVYWADGRNELRGCNVMDPDLHSYSVDKFSTVANAILNPVEIEIVNNVGGKFKSGTVQYTYRLKTGAAKTTYASIDDRAYIYQDGFPVGATYKINGSNRDEQTSKSVSVSIDVGYSNFDSIELYRVFYSSTSPVVDLIYDGPHNNPVFKYTDNGENSLEVIDPRELNHDNVLFTPQTLTSIDNRLFAGNIKEANFDVNFDAKAYRYKALQDGTTGTYIRTTTDIKKYVSDSNTFSPQPGDSVPTDADMILENTDINKYKYSYIAGSISLSDLGGTGRNIEYGFTTTETSLDTEISSKRVSNWDSMNAGDISPTIAANRTSFMRGETYRVGIVFINAKGQKSFVKWIGDIKMPSQAEYDILRIANGSTAARQVQLGLEVEVKNIPIDKHTNKPLSYRIVHVKRANTDRSIIDQGYIIQKDSKDFQKELENTGNTIDTGTTDLFFISPNNSFFKSGKNMSYSNLTMEVINKRFSTWDQYHEASVNQLDNGCNENPNTTYDTQFGWCDWKVKKFYSRNTQGLASHEIESSRYLESGTNKDGFKTDWETDTISASKRGATSIGLILKDPTAFGLGNIVNITTPVPGQYGGPGYAARTNNSYVPSGPINNPSTQTHTSTNFNGDVFVTFFVVPVRMVNPEATSESDGFPYQRGLLHVAVVPLESVVNTELSSTRNALDDDWRRGYYVEKSGVYTMHGGTCAATSFSQTFDAFAYNSAYSNFNESITYNAKPLNWYPKFTDNLIRYSDKNLPFQDYPNWSSWKTNNYQAVDKKSGVLTTIDNWVGSLLFMQESGFGTCLINERVTQMDPSGTTTILGKGDTLGKPNYVSMRKGSIHKGSVITTNNSVTFYDKNTKGVILYQKAYSGNSSKEVTKLKGVNYLLKGFKGLMNSTNKVLYSSSYTAGLPPLADTYIASNKTHVGVIGVELNNNIYYTFYDKKEWYVHIDGEDDDQYNFSSDKETIMLNGDLQAFTSTFDFDSPIYDVIGGNITMLDPNEMRSIWIKSENAERGSYFGVKNDTTITLGPNGANPFTKIATNFTYTMDVTDVNGDDLRTETFNNVEFKNTYQQVASKLLVPISRRRFRKWSVTIPRADKIGESGRNDIRLRDKFIEAKFSFINNLNKKMKLYDMKFTYRINQDEFRKLNKK